MSTITQDVAVELAERQLEAASVQRDDARANYDAVQARVAELADDAAHETVETLARELEEAGQAFEDAHAEAERCKGNLEAAKRRARIEADTPKGNAVARGQLRAELTYRPDMRGAPFFRDCFLAQYQMDSEARERLGRNSREQYDIAVDRGLQYRDVGTGAFTGIVVPQYLVDQFVENRKAGAPLLEYVRKLELPDVGMTVNIGRLTTGSGVAAQATENTAVQETDVDDTLLTVDVRTYSGQQDMSRQSLERDGGGITDMVVYEDLTRAYFTTLDSAAINAAGTSGTHLGIRSTVGIVAVTYTDATPTVGEAYAKLADAIQQINAGIFARAELIVMHPRRWGWLTAALDSQNRPLVVPRAYGPFNAAGINLGNNYGVPVGDVHGLPVITDANIPTNLGAGTNEDVILILATSELFLWQEADGLPRRFRFEQVAPPQSIRLAVWAYTAFTAGRFPTGSATIGGTGLVAPTF